MKTFIPVFILIMFIYSCEKNVQCGQDIIIDSLELSPAVEEGLLLKGTERIVFNDGEGNKIIFKSPHERQYQTNKELLYIICGNDDYRNNQYEVVETENYRITYSDSLDPKKVMLVNAVIRRRDTLLEEELDITILFNGQRQSIAPYVWGERYNIQQKKKYEVPTLYEENPFLNIIFDTTFNNKPYQGVIKFNSDGGGNEFYNRYGILQFTEIGDKVWTVESIQ
ncbi:MAG: hypothetical protein WBP41_09065 [Saprospiraceae bacterium]